MDQPSDFGGLFSAKRVVVVGANGAGKTWLASRLANRLGLPLIHNDALALTTHWVRRRETEVRSSRDQHVSEPAWIIEGGPSALTDKVLSRTDLILWLDLPRQLRTWRVFRRTLRFMGRERPEHPPGNREWPGPRQVRFLMKTWTNDAKVRAMIEDRLTKAPAPVIRLTTAAGINALHLRLQEDHDAVSPLH